MMINWILDLLLPQKCLGCGVRGEILCDDCVLQIHHAEREMSRNIYASFDYRDPLIKRAIWDLKYYNRKSLGQKLGKLLYEAQLEDISDLKIYAGNSPIYIIPVPTSRKRKRVRGYNQAIIIARGFCNLGNKGSKQEIFKLKENIVIKKLDTIPQARITNRTRRLRNIHGAFEIKNLEVIRGKTIIVIDDVTTTGATLSEIINILNKSGAKHVVGFAVAH